MQPSNLRCGFPSYAIAPSSSVVATFPRSDRRFVCIRTHASVFHVIAAWATGYATFVSTSSRGIPPKKSPCVGAVHMTVEASELEKVVSNIT